MVGLNLLVTGKPGVGKTNPRWAHCQAVKLFAASRWLYDGRDEQPDRRETRSGLALSVSRPIPFPKPIHTK
jgi:hypothetical protein